MRVSAGRVVYRGMASVKIGGFAEVAASTDAKTGDLRLGARTSAFWTNSTFGIVFRAGNLLKSMAAAAADIVEQRHPLSSLVLLLKARKLRVLKPLRVIP
jgi:hypothetical protein